MPSSTCDFAYFPSVRRAVKCLVISAGLAISPASAQDPSTATAIAVGFGIGILDTWLDAEKITVPPSKLDPAEQGAATEAALKRYQDARNVYSLTGDVGNSVMLGTGAIIAGAALYAGPQSTVTVPLTLLGGASLASLKMTNDAVERRGQEVADAYLGKFGRALFKDAGIEDLDSFEGSPKELRDRLKSELRSNDKYLADVKERVADVGDDDLIDMTADVIARRATALNNAMLTAMENNEEAIANADRKLGNFSKLIKESLKATETAMAGLEDRMIAVKGDMQQLSGKIRVMTDEIQKLGENQDIITGFVFGQLPPGEKALLLKRGLMDNRIVCPTEIPDCDINKIKAAMIDRFETDQEIKENIAFAGEILRDINSVAQISENLGIDLGETGDAIVNITGGAVNAYMSVMSGNWLGAAAQITGIFGGAKPDPDAERFKIMMAYLQKQFGIINEKIDKVITNQKAIFEAVEDVSLQVQRSHELLDARLSELEWLTRQTDQNVKQLIWSDWQFCHSVYQYAALDRQLVELDTLRFHSFVHLDQAIRGRKDAAESCITTFQARSASLSKVALFGNFLSSGSAISSDVLSEAECEDAAVANKSDGTLTEQERRILSFVSGARCFQREIIRPSHAIVAAWIAENDLGWSDMLELQTDTLADTRELSDMLDLIDADWVFDCSAADRMDAGHSFDSMLCGKEDPPDRIAAALMADGITVPTILEMSKWVMVVAQIADAYDGSPPNSQREFAQSLQEIAVRDTSNPLGREMISSMLDLVNLGIAFHNRAYGGLTAHIIAEAIEKGISNSQMATLLAANRILAENVSLILMRNAIAVSNTDQSKMDEFENPYIQALLISRSENPFPLDAMHALFSDKLTFRKSDESKAVLVVPLGESEKELPLPRPRNFATGAFAMPIIHPALLSAREALVDRLAGYWIALDPVVVQSIVDVR